MMFSFETLLNFKEDHPIVGEIKTLGDWFIDTDFNGKESH